MTSQIRIVEGWCCGIAADDELGNAPITVYHSEDACYAANQCSREEPKWCKPRRLTISFETNWISAGESEQK